MANSLYVDPLGLGEACCGALRESLASDPGYREVFNMPGAAVFQRLATP